MVKLRVEVFWDELRQEQVDMRYGFRGLDDCGAPRCNRAHLPPSRRGLAVTYNVGEE